MPSRSDSILQHRARLSLSPAAGKKSRKAENGETETDVRWMREALRLARLGGDLVRPNPQVGCVLVRNGRVVARGFHRIFGGPHAEAAALKSAGTQARGATAYVNLEPCCHLRKKTPPCVPALLSAGVRRVVIGMKDPNPVVSGRGIRRLRRAGIDVQCGVLEEECKSLNRPFLRRMKSQRPYVILKAAASLDGRIQTASKDSKWITSPEARQVSHRMRGREDALLSGIGTILQDNPGLTAHGLGRNPVRIVLDSSFRIPRHSKVLDGQAPTLIFTTRRKDFPSWAWALPKFSLSDKAGAADLRASLEGYLRPAKTLTPAERRTAGRESEGLSRRMWTPPCHPVLILSPGPSIDPLKVLLFLFNAGIGSLIVEGGSGIHSSFLDSGLVDEIRLFLAPLLIGGKKALSFFEGRGASLIKDALRLRAPEFRTLGKDLLITGWLGDSKEENAGKPPRRKGAPVY